MFLGLGIMIFGLPVKFYLLGLIFGSIQRLFDFRVERVGVVISQKFWVSGPRFLDFSSNFTSYYRFLTQSRNFSILGWGEWVWSLPEIFEFRDLDFWISRRILPTRVDFQGDPTDFYFAGR